MQESIQDSQNKGCLFGPCDREPWARSMCAAHYWQWREGKELYPIGEGHKRASPWYKPDGTKMLCGRKNCNKEVQAIGFCHQHAHQARKEAEVAMGITCTFGDCNKPIANNQLCSGHSRQKRHGKELMPLGYADCPIRGCTKKMRPESRVCEVHRKPLVKYNLTPEQLIGLFDRGKCYNEECDETKGLHVDHDHACCDRQGSCGKCVRGLLCQRCNTALAMLGDSMKKMDGLREYLKE